MRGWMMSRQSVWRDSTRGARPPTDGDLHRLVLADHLRQRAAGADA